MKDVDNDPGRCCENGYFNDGHKCMKEPGDAPTSPLSIPSIKAQMVRLHETRQKALRDADRCEGALAVLGGMLTQAENYAAAARAAELAERELNATPKL